MTTDRILNRYTRDIGASPAEDADDIEDLGAFGYLRGIKDRAVMLEFRMKDGNSVAFDYGWLRKVEYNPSEGVTLHFGSSETVKIIGRNLHRPTSSNAQLCRGILSHRVPWIQEASEPDILKSPSTVTVIEQIVFPSANR